MIVPQSNAILEVVVTESEAKANVYVTEAAVTVTVIVVNVVKGKLITEVGHASTTFTLKVSV